MKRVLIATTNNDKYTTVKGLFERTIFPKEFYSIDSLHTLNIKLNDSVEVGDNINRARTKALDAFNQLKDYNFDYIVGLDDAIRIKGELRPNIKDYLKKILYEDFLSDKEVYSFSRAYVIIDKNGVIYETTAEIPYYYKKMDNAELKEFSYPLSQVSCPIGSDKAICFFTEEEAYDYYLKYVKDKLNSIKIKNLELYVPKLEEYFFEEELESDPDTMSYNAGYDVSYDGYHYDTGCIDFPRDRWIDTYNKRQNNNGYFAYIKDLDKDIFVGYVNYSYDKDNNRYDCGVLISNKYRGLGYGKIALQLLINKAKSNGIKELYDTFEETRKNAYKLFLDLGFEIVDRINVKKFDKDNLCVVLRKEL